MKVDFCSQDFHDFFIKDGLIFAHSEQEYFSGLNPFNLHWKDNCISFYAPYQQIKTAEYNLQTVDTVLKFTEN